MAEFGRRPKNAKVTASGETIDTSTRRGTQGVSSGNLTSQLYLPHVGMYKIDIDSLSLLDYHSMKDYYQIRTAFAMISFTLMSVNWWIEGGTAETRKAVEWQINEIWSDLMKTITKAFWSGFSPNVKIFDVHPTTGYLYIKELKDLSPFTCKVSIDKKDQSFDGFIQSGGTYEVNTVKGGQIQTESISVDAQKIDSKYAFWYSFMMEDGDFYGTKLLKGAYIPWFFSQVMHLYENRYFYRFSTPLAVGHAPSGYVSGADGNNVPAQDIMIDILKEIRNNSSVSLPSEKDENGNPVWDIKYLESQMRGWDFETYLKRLDKEMARALFLPDLVFEAGRVGSFKLGELHKDTFLMLLNALMNDVKQHIDKYISKQFVENNFGPDQEVPSFHYEKQGTVSTPIIVDLINEMVKDGRVDVDIADLAKMTGVPLKEAEKVTGEDLGASDEDAEKPDDKKDDKKDDNEEDDKKEENSRPVNVNVYNTPANVSKDSGIEKDVGTMLDRFDKRVSEAIAEGKVEGTVKNGPNANAKVVQDEFYDIIMYIASSQVGRIGALMDSKDRSLWPKSILGYRSKLEKVWGEYVTEDTIGLYDGAMKFTTAILASDKSAGEIKTLLWSELTDYYLTMAFKKNPELALGLAAKVDTAIFNALD